MGYNYLCWLPVFISLITNAGQNVTETSKIHWDEGRKLSWQDFKGNPREGSKFSAESSLQISYGLKISEQSGVTNFSFTVDCYFERQDSWVKPEKKTDALLNHEQLHFDIAEYFSRKLRREFQQNSFTIQNYKSKSTAIFDKNFAEYKSQQRAYDEETHHGSKPEEQAQWDERVRGLLAKSESYKKK